MQAVFPIVVYLLCLLTSASCAWLLSRSYRRTRARLLLWSSLCFTLLAINNLLLVVDMVLLPDTDLRIWRLIPMFLAVCVLLFGFIWDLEEER